MHDDVFNFRNEDGVIAGFICGFKPTFQVRQSPAQYGSPMLGELELCSNFLPDASRIAVGHGVVL